MPVSRTHLFCTASFAFIIFVALVFLPTETIAQTAGATISAGLDEAASGTYSQGSLAVLIGKLISGLLSVTGIIFLALTIYAGILYMTAMGEPDKVKKAKNILTYTILGLIIIVGAYAFTGYVINALSQATSATEIEEIP
jgi:hypothetical protein